VGSNPTPSADCMAATAWPPTVRVKRLAPFGSRLRAEFAEWRATRRSASDWAWSVRDATSRPVALRRARGNAELERCKAGRGEFFLREPDVSACSRVVLV